MELLYFPLELFSAIAVFVIGLKRREHFGMRILAVAGILLLFIGQIYLGIFITADHFSNTKIPIFIGFIQILTIMVLMVWWLFRITFREAIYCITCTYLTEHIAYCIRLIIRGVTRQSWAETGHLLYFLIHIGVYIATYFIFAKHMRKNGHYVTSALQSAGLMAAVLFIVLLMSLLATEQDFEFAHGVYALFFCIFTLYSQLNQQKQLNLQQKLSTQEQLWMRARAQYEMSKETIDIINQKCHDLKHQVAALRTTMDSELQHKAIDEIEDSVMIYDSMLKTGNNILDTVLTEKSLICKQKQIVMTCIADGHILCFMDTIDLYTLFGNALDNAIEAVQILPVDERAISLLVHEKAGLIFIQVENRYAGTIKMKNGLPQTQKNDKSYHGFGLQSIIRITEKYKGFVTIETEGQIFLLRLTIPRDGLRDKTAE